MLYTLVSSILVGATVVLADPVISTFANTVTLPVSFDPIKAAYWTGLPHHRRTPFSVSPDGNSAYLAYLDSSYSTVHVLEINVTDFSTIGTAYSTTGYEAAGLVAQNDGFALFATINATGTTDLPTDNYPISALIRVKDGAEAWRTPMNGPGVNTDSDSGLTSSPDANGDLVYSEAAGLYAAYFVVASYTGDYAGHYGDSIQYVDDTGALKQITGASSTFGCSHNTGIGLEAADAAPFASVCAEDQGDIWLNTETQYMSGVKIANENTTNGVSGEPMGGMSGSYSNLALFPDTTSYIFAWQSRGALDLTENTWMGDGYTQCSPRWLNHNVAITTMTNKTALTGQQATSVVGATEGDDQVTWLTYSSTEDHQNVHVAAISGGEALVSWEVLTNPDCQPVPLGCTGTFAGTSFQVVNETGGVVGSVVNEADVTVSGDMVTIGGKVCWPFVQETWDLSQAKSTGTLTTKMSFACAAFGSGSTTTSATTSAAASSVASTSTAASSVASSTASVASAAAVVEPSAAVESSVAASSSAVVVESSIAESSSVSTEAAVATTSAVSSSAVFTTAPIATSTPVTSSLVAAVASSIPVAETASSTAPAAVETASPTDDDDTCEA